MCGFIAQLVEHRTGIAEVTGSNPVEALIFFRLLHSNCLNWKFTAKITYHLHIYPQFIYESFHILHVRVKCLAQEHSAVPQAGLEPRSLDLESSVLTTKPLHLPAQK